VIFAVLSLCVSVYLLYLKTVSNPKALKTQCPEWKFVRDTLLVSQEPTQATLYRILKRIDFILKKHDIIWLVNGGTALGAYTFAAFNPWDDDVDICVLDKDYDKAQRLIHQDSLLAVRKSPRKEAWGYWKEVHLRDPDNDAVWVDLDVCQHAWTNAAYPKGKSLSLLPPFEQMKLYDLTVLLPTYYHVTFDARYAGWKTSVSIYHHSWNTKKDRSRCVLPISTVKEWIKQAQKRGPHFIFG